MGGYWTFPQCGSFMVSQRRYALRRHSSMNDGSFFFAEMVRMMSSLRPGGTVSVSTSVTNPYAYSRLTSASIPELIPTPWRFYTSRRRFNLKQFCRDSQANDALSIPLSRQHLRRWKMYRARPNSYVRGPHNRGD